MTRLNGDAMGAIAARVFRDRTATLSEAGSEYELDEMTHAIRAIRTTMRTALADLPDSAFDTQSAAEGEAAWSAGQIMVHLGNSQTSMSGAVRSLLDMPEEPERERHAVDAVLPSREESLAVLSAIEPEFDAFVAAVSAGADLGKTMSHAR